MGKKETLLAELTSADLTGYLPQIHDVLVASGLKFERPENSQTLFYFVRNTEKKKVGLAALRVRGSFLFSFPKRYWSPRAQEVDAALFGVLPSSIVETEGRGSSSQYSMRQVAVSTHTLPILLRVIAGVIADNARRVIGNV